MKNKMCSPRLRLRMRTSSTVSLSALAIALSLIGSASAFSSPSTSHKLRIHKSSSPPMVPPLFASSKSDDKLDDESSSSGDSSSSSSSSKLDEMAKSFKQKFNIVTKKDREAEQSSRREKWLGWMATGQKPRMADAVIMRESTLLGGLPRSERYSSRDWWHNTVNMPSSTVLKDVQGPVNAMTIWAGIVSVVHRILLKRHPVMAGHMTMPTAPHSMLVSALGLLLVFRTNSAYQRFAEGRKIWEGILNYGRDLSRMIKLFEVQIGKERRRRVQRLLAAFPYLLRYRIRPSSVKDGGQMRRYGDAATDDKRDPANSLFLYLDAPTKENDYEAAKVASEEEMTGMSRRQKRDLYWVDKRTLPWRLLKGDAMEKCARAQNRPLWVCDRMAKELISVPDQNGPIPFTNRERMALVALVDGLSRSIGSCERIHQTVVPLNYARHALRALTLWLLSLPFALVKDLGLLTSPVLFIISWMLFGIYEIGTRIEDPFQGTLRLSILCDQMRRDVLSDELLRDTAYTIDLPKKKKEEISESSEQQFAKDGEEDDDEEEGQSDMYENSGDDRQQMRWVNGAPASLMKQLTGKS
mmetsp:Transcript_22000/g.63076  ORF Transcript_22000/g.63076 Transcript_22000/m.63076 type:complete len:582 (+) Transcript_22000:198-1943(+)